MDIPPFDGDEFAVRPSRSPSGDAAVGDAHALNVTASATHMETIRFLHRWTIDQFSVQQELSEIGACLESSPFGSANGVYKFRLKLFPTGKDEECRGYLSLFLQIQKCPTPKVRFRVNFYIETTEGPRGCALNRNVVTINKGGIVTASKFFSMETLKSRASRFLPDDTLTVGVELTVFGEQLSRDIPIDQISGIASASGEAARTEPPNGSIGADLGQLLESSDYADCRLHVGRKTFAAHKAILSARSPVFAAMFAHEGTLEAQTSEATLADVTPEAVGALLDFVYTDRCADISDRAAEILAAADKYCLDRLKADCEDQLCADLSQQNMCDRLRLADAFGAKKLRQRVLLTFQRHKNQVLGSREWAELETECPALAAVVLKELMTMPEDTGLTTMARLSMNEPPSKRVRTH